MRYSEPLGCRNYWPTGALIDGGSACVGRSTVGNTSIGGIAIGGKVGAGDSYTAVSAGCRFVID